MAEMDTSEQVIKTDRSALDTKPHVVVAPSRFILAAFDTWHRVDFLNGKMPLIKPYLLYILTPSVAVSLGAATIIAAAIIILRFQTKVKESQAEVKALRAEVKALQAEVEKLNKIKNTKRGRSRDSGRRNAKEAGSSI